MTLTNFPTGFLEGVSVRNVPILNQYSGNIYWVDSTNPYASAGGPGTFDNPFSTISAANGLCVANNGDIILVASGHVETLSSAGALALSKAGVSVIGVGSGNDRPKITFGTSTGASIAVSGASVTIQNIIGIAGIDGLTNPINITGDDAYIDITWRDGSAAIEAVRAVLATTVSRLNVNLVYEGFIAGNATVNAIRLVAVTGANILVDFYGVASTSVIEFLTTASTNVYIDPASYFYNSGTTNGTKNIVDTVGGSTWYAPQVNDGAAGQAYSGGSASALASDDVSAVIANQAVPTADVTTNTLERDVVGNKTDAAVTAVGTTKTIVAYAKGLVTMNTVQSADSTNNAFAGDVVGNKTDAAVTAVGTTKSIAAYAKGLVTMNTVQSADSSNNAFAGDVVGNKTDASVYVPGTTKSVAAYVKGHADLQERVVKKAAATIVNAQTLFTIAGGPIQIIGLVSICETGNDATASTLQYNVTPTSGSAQTISAASASLANATAGASVTLAGTALSTAALYNANGPNLIANPGTIVAPAGVIDAVVAVGSTTGTWAHYLRYKPLAVGVTVS